MNTENTTSAENKWERIIDAMESGSTGRNDDIDLMKQNPEAVKASKDLMACQNALMRKHLQAPDAEAEWKRFSQKIEHKIQQEQKNGSSKKRLRNHSHRFWWGALTGVAASVIAITLYSWIANWPLGGTQIIAFQATDSIQQIMLQTSAGDRIPLGKNTREDVLAIAGTSLQKKDTLALSYTSHNHSETTGSEAENVETHVLSTPRGKDFKLILADGTTVWMNADSRLEYPSRFVGKNRIVSLQGEAYFKVAKDAEHPFIIQTKHMQATVLGTELNVRNYTSKDSHVTLINGRVEVCTPKGDAVSLHPGQDAQWQADGSLSINEVDVDAYIYWRDGYFYFDNVRLVDVMQNLGRWYNINVIFENPKLMDVTIRYFCIRNEPLERAISLLNHMKKIQATISGNTVYIR